jgi:uncharacterized protein (DUF3084 family)
VRLRDLLGLSLEQLSRLLEAETARAQLRREYAETDDPQELRRILEQALVHIGTQLELVGARHREIEQLEQELLDKRADIQARLTELDG